MGNPGAGNVGRNTVANTIIRRQVKNFLQQKTITMVLVVKKKANLTKKTTAEEDVQAIVLDAGNLGRRTQASE